MHNSVKLLQTLSALRRTCRSDASVPEEEPGDPDEEAAAAAVAAAFPDRTCQCRCVVRRDLEVLVHFWRYQRFRLCQRGVEEGWLFIE